MSGNSGDCFDVICDGVANRFRKQSTGQSLVSDSMQQAVVQRYCRLSAASDCSDLDTEMSERLRLVSPHPASQRLHQPASAPWPASLLPLAVVSKYKVRISPRMTTFIKSDIDIDCFCALNQVMCRKITKDAIFRPCLESAVC